MTKGRSATISTGKFDGIAITYKSIGNVGCGVENSKTPCKFASSIKCGQIVNDQRKEAGLCHAEEESQGKKTAKVLHTGG
jgi:hypothetical protein